MHHSSVRAACLRFSCHEPSARVFDTRELDEGKWTVPATHYSMWGYQHSARLEVVVLIVFRAFVTKIEEFTQPKKAVHNAAMAAGHTERQILGVCLFRRLHPSLQRLRQTHGFQVQLQGLVHMEKWRRISASSGLARKYMIQVGVLTFNLLSLSLFIALLLTCIHPACCCQWSVLSRCITDVSSARDGRELALCYLAARGAKVPEKKIPTII